MNNPTRPAPIIATLSIALIAATVIFAWTYSKRAPNQIQNISVNDHQLTIQQEQVSTGVDKTYISDRSLMKFLSSEDFFEAKTRATRNWREKRGYQFVEDFGEYSGPETYTGQHAYGYMREEEIKYLAETGDIEAQMLYAYHYLKDRPGDAYTMLNNIAVSTEQTAPLMWMVGKVWEGHMNRVNDFQNSFIAGDGENSYPENERYDNEMQMLALTMYLKERNDPLAAKTFEILEAELSLSQDRLIEAEVMATEIASIYNNQRQQAGLPPFESFPLDIAAEMGLTEEQYHIELTQSESQ